MECERMENKSNQLRTELKREIDRDSRFGPWMQILVTIVLPIVEGILVNIWTGAQMKGPAGPCLLVIAIFHLIVGGLVIWNGFRAKSPLRVLADAADLADTNCSTQRELDRRVQTYRMFVDAIEEMNAQVCSIQTTGESFDVKLRPIIRRFLNAICETIGVCSNRYTLEVYLRAYLFGKPPPYPQLGEYVLAFFDSPTLQADDALRMGAVHPLCISAATNHERMIGRASANPGLFSTPKDSGEKPYFEHYATHVIPTQCRTGHLGYVVFTTSQKEPMATDALETLGLIATVTSTFHSRWYDCETARQGSAEIQQLKMQLHGALRAQRGSAVEAHVRLQSRGEAGTPQRPPEAPAVQSS
jgi:hypothetical protein